MASDSIWVVTRLSLEEPCAPRTRVFWQLQDDQGGQDHSTHVGSGFQEKVRILSRETPQLPDHEAERDRGLLRAAPAGSLIGREHQSLQGGAWRGQHVKEVINFDLENDKGFLMF